MRIKYNENCCGKPIGYFDFCQQCWTKKDLWFNEWVMERMDVDLSSIEFNVATIKIMSC